MENLIDIKLVLTQVLGFVILVAILGRFAWGPIVSGLEARRQKIAGEFAEAERRQKEAEKMRADYEAQLRGIEAEKRTKIQEGMAEGQKLAEEIRAHAQKDAQDRIHKAEDEIAREREKSKELLKEQVIALSLRTAEKILATKLDEPAQRQLASKFIDEVGALK